jgi:hypothetical protein
MAICSVKAVRSQKPLPKESAMDCGEAPMARAATAMITTPARAKMYASGNHFSVQAAIFWATRASPRSSVALCVRTVFPTGITSPSSASSLPEGA